MLRRNDRNLDNIPIGALGLISLEGCEEMGSKVNDYLVKWRREDGHIHKNDVAFSGYEPVSYTHLDVYKRQELMLERQKLPFLLQETPPQEYCRHGPKSA